MQKAKIKKQIKQGRETPFESVAQPRFCIFHAPPPHSNYECGELDIPTEILIKLADFHNISVTAPTKKEFKRQTSAKSKNKETDKTGS